MLNEVMGNLGFQGGDGGGEIGRGIRLLRGPVHKALAFVGGGFTDHFCGVVFDGGEIGEADAHGEPHDGLLGFPGEQADGLDLLHEIVREGNGSGLG